MSKKIEIIQKSQLKKGLPEIRPGDNIKVYQKIKEGKGTRIQAFEGIVIAKKHGQGVSSTITVRKVISGIGVEKIFPVHSPLIEKIEILKRSKVRRAKLYYLRNVSGKKARLKKKGLEGAIVWEKTEDKKTEEGKKEESERENSQKKEVGFDNDKQNNGEKGSEENNKEKENIQEDTKEKE